MLLAVAVLPALFERHIYSISSLFFGFVLASVPLVMEDEMQSLRSMPQGFAFTLAGLAAVMCLTAANGKPGAAAIDLAAFSAPMAIKLFLIGMAAVSAMFLPGISGSTLLLIFGAYIPVITAMKELLSLNFLYLPCLACFGCGILAGAGAVVRAIRACLEKIRPQTVYLIQGMMIGSLYAIGMGSTTLKTPQPPLDLGNFAPLEPILGAALVWGMQKIRARGKKAGH